MKNIIKQCDAFVESITEEEIIIRTYGNQTYKLPCTVDQRRYGLLADGRPSVIYPDGAILERDNGQMIFYEDGTHGFAPSNDQDVS